MSIVLVGFENGTLFLLYIFWPCLPTNGHPRRAAGGKLSQIKARIETPFRRVCRSFWLDFAFQDHPKKAAQYFNYTCCFSVFFVFILFLVFLSFSLVLVVVLSLVALVLSVCCPPSMWARTGAGHCSLKLKLESSLPFRRRACSIVLAGLKTKA